MDRRRLALAVMTFGVAAMIAYLGQRVFERARGGAPDPLMMLEEPHVAFYWRSAIAAWWGGLAAIVAYAASARSRSHGRTVRWVAIASVPAAILHVLLSWLLP